MQTFTLEVPVTLIQATASILVMTSAYEQDAVSKELYTEAVKMSCENILYDIATQHPLLFQAQSAEFKAQMDKILGKKSNEDK